MLSHLHLSNCPDALAKVVQRRAFEKTKFSFWNCKVMFLLVYATAVEFKPPEQMLFGVDAGVISFLFFGP